MNTTSDPRAASIGVLRETLAGERRVALVPADVKRLATRANLYVEQGAGALSGFTDQDYVAAGARVAAADVVVGATSIVVKIRPPQAVAALRPHGVLISLGAHDADLGARLHERLVTHLGLERLPRSALAQRMDTLSSQAAIAGYAAVLEGARWLNVLLPMMTTAAGTIKPARMMALGAGVAGLQAIATARRLGATVYGFDVREAAREQVESLGARFVSLDRQVSGTEAAGGYAQAQSDDELRSIRQALTEHISTMQLVVTSAQVPGRRAPLLIDDVNIGALKPGAVIVDLAAESGGNTAFTSPDEAVTVAGVHVLGPTNLPSAVAADASRLFSGNIRALLEHIVDANRQLVLNDDDAITSALLGRQTRTGSVLASQTGDRS